MNKKNISILVVIIVLTIIAVFTTFNLTKRVGVPPKYPSTYFIEPPSILFVECHTNDDCLKIKGTACQPSKGGTEICINKNYMQEYLSNIETLSGKEWEVDCPEVNNISNKICSCVNNNCKLVNP